MMGKRDIDCLVKLIVAAGVAIVWSGVWAQTEIVAAGPDSVSAVLEPHRVSREGPRLCPYPTNQDRSDCILHPIKGENDCSGKPKLPL